MTERVDRALVRTALILVLGTFMATLDIAIVTVGIDTLAQEFAAPVSEIHWVTTAYLLAVVAAVPTSGWLAGRFGGRETWIGAMAVFLVGSVLCSVAGSLPLLVAARVVQGIGGGLLPPIGQALLAGAAGPNRIGRMISIAQLVLVVAPVLGPPTGGWLLSFAGWPWLFLINVPIGLGAIALALRFIPKHGTPARDVRFDVVGAMLLTPGLALLTFGLTSVGTDRIPTIGAVAAIVAGLVALAGFLRHGLRARRPPLLDPRLFTRPPFGPAALATMIVGASTFGALFLLPLYLQTGRGLTAIDAGLVLVPQGIGAAVGTLLVNRVIDRLGPRVLVLTGVAFVALGTAVFTQLPAMPPDPLIAASLFVRGAGIPLISAPLLTAVYRAVPATELPRAAAAMNLLSTIGGLLGTAALATVLQHRLAAHVPAAAGLAAAFADAFWWALALSAVAAVAGARLPNRSPAPSGSPTDHR